jgi:phosphinothricin acetyltransferase
VETSGESEFGRRIAVTLETWPWLVSVENGSVTGYAYACRHRERAAYQWCVEVSAYVDETRRGRGVGRSLYRKLFECLRLQGFVNAYAGIALPNDASVAFHESMGFEKVGTYRAIGFKLGAWHDVGWWTLRIGNAGPPAKPRPLKRCIAEIVTLLEDNPTG